MKAHKDSRERKRRKLHKDWRTWAVVALMLAAIGIYCLTLDDSIELSAQSGRGGQVSTTAPARP